MQRGRRARASLSDVLTTNAPQKKKRTHTHNQAVRSAVPSHTRAQDARPSVHSVCAPNLSRPAAREPLTYVQLSCPRSSKACEEEGRLTPATACKHKTVSGSVRALISRTSKLVPLGMCWSIWRRKVVEIYHSTTRLATLCRPCC